MTPGNPSHETIVRPPDVSASVRHDSSENGFTADHLKQLADENPKLYLYIMAEIARHNNDKLDPRMTEIRIALGVIEFLKAQAETTALEDRFQDVL